VPPASEGDPDHSGLSILMDNRQPVQVDEGELVAVAERTLIEEGRDRGELSLSLVTPEEMADLHVRYMGEEGPTDVLSFPMDEEWLLGDVIVCPAEAARNNPDLPAELRLLVSHGVLHILGYDHDEEEGRRVMWAKQAEYSGNVG
jgi:probable rRNA maturation factor